MMNKKKIFGLLFALAFVVTVTLSFSADVSAKGQKSLNDSVKSFMKYARNFQLKRIRSGVDSMGNYGLLYYTDANKKDEMYQYYKRCARKMSYRILSRKQRKNTAVVTMKVRYVNSYRFTVNMIDKISMDLIEGKLDIDDLVNVSEKKMLKYTNKLVRSSVKKAGKTKYRTQTIKLTFVKKNGKWKVKQMTKALDNILQANVPASLEKYVKDFSSFGSDRSYVNDK